MKVKNLNGTADNKCYCASWLAHWSNFSGQKANRCVVNGCSNAPEVGGHVQKDSKTDNGWYIVPLCRTCNGKKGLDIDILDGVNLVSANVADTCGKK
jgi:hypothetical protein